MVIFQSENNNIPTLKFIEKFWKSLSEIVHNRIGKWSYSNLKTIKFLPEIHWDVYKFVPEIVQIREGKCIGKVKNPYPKTTLFLSEFHFSIPLGFDQIPTLDYCATFLCKIPTRIRLFSNPKNALFRPRDFILFSCVTFSTIISYLFILFLKQSESGFK